MSVVTHCTSCGKELRSPDEYAGWKVKCPDCGSINQLPAKEAAQPKAEKRAGGQPAPQKPAAKGPSLPTCKLCGRAIPPGVGVVQDTKGTHYHRTCYEEEVARRKAQKQPGPKCSLCGKAATGADCVKDTKGNVFHKSCYEKERARRQGAKQPSPTALPGLELLEEPSPAAGDDLLGSLSGVNDLWGEMPAGPGPLDAAGSGPLGGAGPLDGTPGGTPLGAGPSLQPARTTLARPSGGGMRRSASSGMSTWMYVLMGVGGAVPIVVLLFVIVKMAMGPDEEPPGPVAVAPATAPGEQPGEQPGAPTNPGGPPPFPGTEESNGRKAYPDSDGHSSAERPSRPVRPGGGGTIPLGLFCIVIVLAFLLVVGAAFFMLSCKICEVTPPGLFKSMGIVLLANIPCGLANGALSVFLESLGAIGGLGLAIIEFVASLFLYIIIAGLVFSVTLKVEREKGYAIAFVNAMIQFGILLVIGVLMVVIVGVAIVNAGP